MQVGVLTLHLLLPGCTSLKEKRSRIKPLLARLHREFNISVAEIEHQDAWQQAVIACAIVSNDRQFSQQILYKVVEWIENSWPDVLISWEQVEML